MEKHSAAALHKKTRIMNCSRISKNLVLAACTNAVAGIEPEIILLNKADIDSVALESGVLSEITLKDAVYGVKYTSAKNAFEATVALNKGTYMNSFTHGVVCRVFSREQQTKDELNRLANAKVVAIVKNLDAHNDETKYEVYGLESGLVMTDLQFASTDGDGVVYTFNLGSDDNARESELPASFYKESLATTEAALTALLAPAA